MPASAYLDQLSWVAVDTETSGLNPWEHEIIEIGAVRFSLDREEDQFEVLIRPEGKIDPRSRAVHQITNEELEEKGVSLEVAMEQFLAFIGSESLVFHNAPFDVSFIIRSLQKVGLEVPQNSYYDSLYLSRKYFAHRKKHSLAALRDMLNIPVDTLHRALPDARLTARVFSETVQSKAQEITSNSKFQNFIRSHGRLNKFKIRLPQNMDEINQYCNRQIKSGSLLRVDYRDKGEIPRSHFVKFLDVMIFNQNPFVKVQIAPEMTEQLISLRHAIIHDPEKGKIRLVEKDQ